jgi:hypothetical protein
MSTAYESELESALEEEFGELSEYELEDDPESERFLGGLASVASGLGKIGSVAGSIGKIGSSVGKLGGLAGGLGKLGGAAGGLRRLGGAAGGLRRLGGAAGGLRRLGGVGRVGGIGRLGRSAAGFSRLGARAGRYGRRVGGAARSGRSARSGGRSGAGWSRSLTRTLDKTGIFGKPGTLNRWTNAARDFGKTRSLSSLVKNVDKFGVLGKPGTLARWVNLAGNFAKTRSLRGLTRDLDKVGVFGRPGTLGRLGTLAGNFGKTRSLSGLARDVDKLGILAKPGALGKLGALAGNFGRSRTLGQFVTNAAPLLKATSKMAAPMVASAIGGPFGAMAAKLLTRGLREAEGELYELENEYELETELSEGWHEAELEILSHELGYHEALAEMMAEAAEQEQNEAEAEAMAGAAALTVISAADRLALRRVLPHLVRGTAILTRVLRANPRTRPAVRAVPTIARRTVRALKREAEAGTPITRSALGRAAAREVRRILGNPVACASAMANNVLSARALRAAA